MLAKTVTVTQCKGKNFSHKANAKRSTTQSKDNPHTRQKLKVKGTSNTESNDRETTTKCNEIKLFQECDVL